MEILFGLTDADFLLFDDAREVLQVKRLIQPTLVRRSPILGPAFNDFIEDILQICGAQSHAAAEFPRRLLISRIGVAPTAPLARVTVEPEALEAVAVAHGISVVHPERMPWLDQVRMLAKAEFIMGEFGSGLHNSVFSNADAITVTIGNSVMSWTQSAIAATRGQRLQYVMPRKETRENSRVLIHYDPEALDACIGRLLALL
jgi:capsular polysaccharide biosynthesis protein